MRNLPALVAFLCACSGPAAPTPSATGSAAQAVSNGTVDSAGLLGQWVHLHEQDEGDVQHWVAPGTSVPRSMFREVVTLEAGGKAKVLCPSPTDAHQDFEGTWTSGPGGKLDIEVACFGHPHPMHFTVVETTKPMLRLRLEK